MRSSLPVRASYCPPAHCWPPLPPPRGLHPVLCGHGQPATGHICSHLQGADLHPPPPPWWSGSEGTCPGTTSRQGCRVPLWRLWRSTSISPSNTASWMSRPTDTTGGWPPHLPARPASLRQPRRPSSTSSPAAPGPLHCSLAPPSLQSHHHPRSGPHWWGPPLPGMATISGQDRRGRGAGRHHLHKIHKKPKKYPYTFLSCVS